MVSYLLFTIHSLDCNRSDAGLFRQCCLHLFLRALPLDVYPIVDVCLRIVFVLIRQSALLLQGYLFFQVC